MNNMYRHFKLIIKSCTRWRANQELRRVTEYSIVHIQHNWPRVEFSFGQL